MSHSSTTDRSHAATWIIFILAVPLLYVLGLPPLVYGTYKVGLWDERVMPRWLPPIVAPYDALDRITPLKDPLHAYAEWWRKVMDVKFS